MNHKITMSAFFAAMALAATAQLPVPDKIATAMGELVIQPINHATFVLAVNKKIIYVDPAGGAAAFKGMPVPDIILITDIHGDHLNPETLAALPMANVIMVAPKAVAEKIPADMRPKQVVILNNGDKTALLGIGFTAVPMYNLPETPDAFHTKGRGNGYVLNIGGKLIYISGDTADIPEMRALQNIDIAFVCMNLPYTMDVNHAASAVLDFKPKIIYPYHYKGQDVEQFKKLVNEGNKNIEVRLRDWYGGGK